jgi:SpoVK/Ycf46/Vps4 family AAA+-type ATPase
MQRLTNSNPELSKLQKPASISASVMSVKEHHLVLLADFLFRQAPRTANMYIGKSEANVRRVLQLLRDACLSVVFFAKLASGALNPACVRRLERRHGPHCLSTSRQVRCVSSVSSSSSSGGGDSSRDIFVIGATNRLDLLDPALLSPRQLGRHSTLA